MQMNNFSFTFSLTVFVVIMTRDTNLCCKGPDNLEHRNLHCLEQPVLRVMFQFLV